MIDLLTQINKTLQNYASHFAQQDRTMTDITIKSHEPDKCLDVMHLVHLAPSVNILPQELPLLPNYIYKQNITPTTK